MDLFPSHAAIGQPTLDDAHLALACVEAPQRGTVVRRAGTGTHITAAAAKDEIAGSSGAIEKRVIGRNHLPARVENHDAVVDAVDDRLEAPLLSVHLVEESGHRVRHGVELSGEPGHGVGSGRRDTLIQIALGDEPRCRLEPLEPSKHGETDHERNAGNEQQRQRRRAESHPSQIAIHPGPDRRDVHVEHQHAIDAIRGIVTFVADRLVHDRNHGSEDRPPASLDHAAVHPLRGGKLVAGLAGGRAGLKIDGCERRARELHDAVAIEQRYLLGVRPPTEGVDHLRNERPVVREHLMFEGVANQLTLGARGVASVFEQALGMVT